MRLSDLAEAAQILAKYTTPDDPLAHVQAEHDRIWIGSADWPVSPEDRERLDALGVYLHDDDMGWYCNT